MFRSPNHRYKPDPLLMLYISVTLWKSINWEGEGRGWGWGGGQWGAGGGAGGGRRGVKLDEPQRHKLEFWLWAVRK